MIGRGGEIEGEGLLTQTWVDKGVGTVFIVGSGRVPSAPEKNNRKVKGGKMLRMGWEKGMLRQKKKNHQPTLEKRGKVGPPCNARNP